MYGRMLGFITKIRNLIVDVTKNTALVPRHDESTVIVSYDDDQFMTLVHGFKERSCSNNNDISSQIINAANRQHIRPESFCWTEIVDPKPQSVTNENCGYITLKNLNGIQ